MLVVFVFKRFLLKVGRVDDASDTCEYVQYFGEIDLKLRDLVQLMQNIQRGSHSTSAAAPSAAPTPMSYVPESAHHIRRVAGYEPLTTAQPTTI